MPWDHHVGQHWVGGGAEAAFRVVLLALHPPPLTKRFPGTSEPSAITIKATKEVKDAAAFPSQAAIEKGEEKRRRKHKEMTKKTIQSVSNPPPHFVFPQVSGAIRSVTHKAKPRMRCHRATRRGGREQG